MADGYKHDSIKPDEYKLVRLFSHINGDFVLGNFLLALLRIGITLLVFSPCGYAQTWQ